MSSLALNQVSTIFKYKGGQKNKTNNNNSLMLSYYNLAVQQEFLKRDIDSKISYANCEKLAQKEKQTNSESDNPLFKKLKKVFFNIHLSEKITLKQQIVIQVIIVEKNISLKQNLKLYH